MADSRSVDITGVGRGLGLSESTPDVFYSEPTLMVTNLLQRITCRTIGIPAAGTFRGHALGTAVIGTDVNQRTTHD